MSTAVHKPDRRLGEPKDVLLGFLDYYRSVIARKVEGLTDEELRESRLPLRFCNRYVGTGFPGDAGVLPPGSRPES